MDTDLLLVIGITLGVLSVPAMISAFSEGRPPRFAAVVVLVAGTLVLVALGSRPGGYTLDDVLDAFGTVFARYL